MSNVPPPPPPPTSSSVPPPPPPPEKTSTMQDIIGWIKRHPIWAGLAGAACLLIIIVGVAMPAEEIEDDPADEATSESKKGSKDSGDDAEEAKDDQPDPEPKPNTRKAVEAALEDVDLLGEDPELEPVMVKGNWHVAFKVGDNLSNGMIANGANMDAQAILTAVHEAAPDAKSIGIRGLFPLVDKYGNEDDGQVYWALFERGTLNQLNWDAVEEQTLDVEAAADVYVLHPDMR